MERNTAEPLSPSYCHYSAGPCDQALPSSPAARAFFAFASEPSTVAGTVQAAVEQLRRSKPNHQWTSWRDLSIGGQVIFCEMQGEVGNKSKGSRGHHRSPSFIRREDSRPWSSVTAVLPKECGRRVLDARRRARTCEDI